MMRTSVRTITAGFWGTAIITTVLMAALTGMAGVHRILGDSAPGGSLQKVVKTLRNRQLNKEDTENLNAGYYEGLLDEGSRVVSTRNLIMLGPSVDGIPRGPWRLIGDERARGDFLYYDLKPGLDSTTKAFRVFTNSFGLADREYSQEKPPNTLRLAMLGDSIVRGLGVPIGQSFEALLEIRLNQKHVNEEIRRFEILNFGVEAYRITQMLEVVSTKARLFEPDIYMVGLSPLTVQRAWGQHIANLVRDGIDLKYPFLRKVAREARLNRSDEPGTSNAKLAAFRLPALRWALSEMRTLAQRNGSLFVVLLVPTVTDPEEYENDGFAGVRSLVKEMGIPYVDLLDTFAGAPLEGVSIDKVDHHPNIRGHELLSENLYRKMLQNPEISSRLFGSHKN